MNINTVKNTAIVNRSYISRGLIGHRFATKNNVVQQTDGTLWAATAERLETRELNLYRSTDGGFSWQKIYSRASGGSFLNSGRHNAIMVGVQVFEHLDRVFLWNAYGSDTNAGIRGKIFRLDGEPIDVDDGGELNVSLGNVGTRAVQFTHNDSMIYLVRFSDGQIHVGRRSPTNPNTETLASSGANNLPTFDAKARSDGTVDIAVVSNQEAIRYLRYKSDTSSFDLPISVASRQLSGASISDVNVSRDGNGTLLISWSEDTSTQSIIRYARSTNNGANWTLGSVSKSGNYIDAIRNEATSRVVSMGGMDGFILSYVRPKGGLPRTFVRLLKNNILGQEREIATISHPGDRVVGANFFDAPSAAHLSLDSPEHIRVAFQVGEGNSSAGTDTEPVRFGQELLVESAFAPEPAEFTPDEPGDTQRLMTVSVIPGPSANVDYYKAGLTGRHTRRFLASFRRTGTPVRLLRYDPLVNSEVNDRSAYGAPEETTARAIVTPMSYSTPLAATQDDFTTFVERDARKIHLPPNIHLQRDFLLNRGNFLKRTVWSYYFGGNEYEISQVVPHFLDGQLTHYTANSYVIGPSNDPFSRRTIPSET